MEVNVNLIGIGVFVCDWVVCKGLVIGVKELTGVSGSGGGGD